MLAQTRIGFSRALAVFTVVLLAVANPSFSAVPETQTLSGSLDAINDFVFRDSTLLRSSTSTGRDGVVVATCEHDPGRQRVFAVTGTSVIDFSPRSPGTFTSNFASFPSGNPVTSFASQLATSDPDGSAASFVWASCVGNALLLKTDKALYSVKLSSSAGSNTLTWAGPISNGKTRLPGAVTIPTADPTQTLRLVVAWRPGQLQLIQVSETSGAFVANYVMNVNNFEFASAFPAATVTGGVDSTGTVTLWILEETISRYRALDVTFASTGAVNGTSWNTNKYITYSSGASGPAAAVMASVVVPFPFIDRPFLLIVAYLSTGNMVIHVMKASTLAPSLVTTLSASSFDGWTNASPLTSLMLTAKYPRVLMSSPQLPRIAYFGVDVAKPNLVVTPIQVRSYAGNTGTTPTVSSIAGISVSGVGFAPWTDPSSQASRVVGVTTLDDNVAVVVWQQVMSVDGMPASTLSAVYSSPVKWGPITVKTVVPPDMTLLPPSHPYAVETIIVTPLSSSSGTKYAESSINITFSPTSGADGLPRMIGPHSVTLSLSLDNGWLTALPLTLSYESLYPQIAVLSRPPTGGNASTLRQGSTVQETLEIGNTGNTSLVFTLSKNTSSSWAVLPYSLTNNVFVAPGSSVAVKLNANWDASLTPDSTLIAKFLLSTNDPLAPTQLIAWTVNTTSASLFAVISSSHPDDKPSFPVYAVSTVQAGQFVTSSLYLINMATMSATFHIEVITSGYWLLLNGQSSSLVINNVGPNNIVEVSVGFNYSRPQGEHIVNSVDILGEVVYPKLTASLSISAGYPSPTPSQAPYAMIAEMTIKPGSTVAASSAYNIYGAVNMTGNMVLSATDAATFGASKIVMLSAYAGSTFQIRVVPMDVYGNEQTRSLAVGIVTASMTSEADVTVTLPDGLTSAHVVTVKPTEYSSDLAYLSVRVSGLPVADTIFGVVLSTVPCSPGYAPDEHGALCLACGSGTYSSDGAACVPCPGGEISREIASTCTPCSDGQYELERQTCQSCPAGYFSKGASSGSCPLCPEHHTSEGAAAGCTACPAGTQHPLSLMLGTEVSSTAYKCVSCTGKDISIAGGSCTPCDAGYVANSLHTECVACPAGTREVAGVCDVCQGGYTSTDAATACTACPPGYHSGPGDNSCTVCPAGTYTHANGSTSCYSCGAGEWSDEGSSGCNACSLEGMTCTKGIRIFSSNYWRGSRDADVSVVTANTVFHECATGACNTTEDGVVACADKHTGPVCTKCIDGYASTPSGGCFRCPGKSGSYAVAFGVVAIILSIVTFLIARSAMSDDNRKSRHMLIIKIFINYIQLISTLRLFATRAPSMIKGVFGIASTGDGFSLDSVVVQCAYKIPFWTQVSVYLLSPIGVCLIPPMLLMSAYYLRLACRRNPDRDWFQSVSMTGIVIVLFLVYNKVTMTIFSIFNVYPKTIDGDSYMYSDLSEQAYTKKHLMFIAFGVIMAALYVIALPTGALTYIWKNKRRSADPHFKRIFGFLYDGYKLQFCYWEGVIFLRKIIVVALAVFVRDAFFQVFLSALCIVGFLLAHVLVKPFVPPEALGSPSMSRGNMMRISASAIPPHGIKVVNEPLRTVWHGMDEMNVLESLSLCTTFVTMMGCLLYWRYSQYDTVITVILIIVNVGTTATFLWRLFSATISHIKRRLVKGTRVSPRPYAGRATVVEEEDVDNPGTVAEDDATTRSRTASIKPSPTAAT